MASECQWEQGSAVVYMNVCPAALGGGGEGGDGVVVCQCVWANMHQGLQTCDKICCFNTLPCLRVTLTLPYSHPVQAIKRMKDQPAGGCSSHTSLLNMNACCIAAHTCFFSVMYTPPHVGSRTRRANQPT